MLAQILVVASHRVADAGECCLRGWVGCRYGSREALRRDAGRLAPVLDRKGRTDLVGELLPDARTFSVEVGLYIVRLFG